MGKDWSDEDLKQLRQLAKCDTPTSLISVKLGRSKAAIYSKASSMKISLMPARPTRAPVKPEH
jgi:hypothetical protein